MRIHSSISVLALLGAFALGAQAQSFGASGAKTREQHRAEVAAAVKAGQIPRGEAPFGDFSAPLSTQPRSDVKRATALAVARGDIPRGESYGRLEPIVSTKSRAEVRAETREAMRLDLIERGEGSYRVPTEAQLELIRLAGERARAMERALAAR